MKHEPEWHDIPGTGIAKWCAVCGTLETANGESTPDYLEKLAEAERRSLNAFTSRERKQAMIKDWVAHWLLVIGHLISSMGCNLSGSHYRESPRDKYCYLCRRRLPTNGWYVFFLGVRLDFQGCWQYQPKLARWAEVCKLFSVKEVKA